VVRKMSQVYRALEKAEREKQEEAEGESRLNVFNEGKIFGGEELHQEYIKEGAGALEFPFKKGSILISPPNSFGAEQFKKLRTHIFHQSAISPHSMLITSSIPQEGKTIVAVNLAIAISHEINKKVILIDADLRKPKIYIEGFENSKGLSNYLEDEIPLSEILKNSDEEKLWVIPAGKPSSKPSEIIGSKKMKELLKSLHELFEDAYIVIDSPPILATPEPILLSNLVDGVIMVVKADHTPKGAVRKAIGLIGREKIIGIVYNQKDAKYSVNYYNGYYRYNKE
jgi:capsular exopolysaccharide synthesis family protein